LLIFIFDNFPARVSDITFGFLETNCRCFDCLFSRPNLRATAAATGALSLIIASTSSREAVTSTFGEVAECGEGREFVKWREIAADRN
jgi:hypothetical protein